jgi:hypothetical protein
VDEVIGQKSDVLNSGTIVFPQVFFDLRRCLCALVDGDTEGIVG